MSFSSNVFSVDTISIGGTTEQIVKGGRNLFTSLQDGFHKMKQIGVIGWGSQGPAQAQNLRDSLKKTDIKVVVGLREGSSSMEAARREGFDESDGTLGEMFQVIRESDLVIVLISDAAQSEIYQDIFDALKPGATIGFSHGFILGHMKNVGAKWPKDHNVIMVAPKGMGPSVRQLYVQGEETNGAGINSSFAVEQDADGRAVNIALAWSVAIGSPYTFETTMESEYKSDIFGERGILLGGVWGIVEALHRWYQSEDLMSANVAYRASVESITGPISRRISHEGILALYQNLSVGEKDIFRDIYAATYPRVKTLLEEIYDEVSCGNEIRSVTMAKDRPMGTIGNSAMWKHTGVCVRELRDNFAEPHINPSTAGVYIATMMAQIDLLKEKGHSWSEIANESVIEAVDSLNPYMHAQGIGYMVDNCSVTARRGARKWAPRFESTLWHEVFTDQEPDIATFDDFENHPIHEALLVCSKLRPSVDIAVV